jgi:hypothetical protein
MMIPADLLSTAAALRSAFASMGSDIVVLIDTDAEIGERVFSTLGLAASSQLCLVLSSSWTDYGRVLDDAVNGLFLSLETLETADAGFKSQINLVVFNNVSKSSSKPAELCGSSSALPFTPPAPAKAAISDILCHLLTMASSPRCRRFFAGDEAAFASLAAFTARFASGVATIADSVWSHCRKWLAWVLVFRSAFALTLPPASHPPLPPPVPAHAVAAGVPVAAAPQSDAQRASSAQLTAVAVRLFTA